MANITKIDTGANNWGRVTNTNFELLDNRVIGGRNYFSAQSFKANKYVEAYFGMPSINLNLKANTEYTVSTDIPFRNDQGAQDVFAGNVNFQAVSKVNGVSAGSPLTVTTDNTGVLQVSVRYADISNGDYHVQVELGDKASDWKPAIEDLPALLNVTDTGWIELPYLNGFVAATGLGKTAVRKFGSGVMLRLSITNLVANAAVASLPTGFSPSIDVRTTMRGTSGKMFSVYISHASQQIIFENTTDGSVPAQGDYVGDVLWWMVG